MGLGLPKGLETGLVVFGGHAGKAVVDLATALSLQRAFSLSLSYLVAGTESRRGAGVKRGRSSYVLISVCSAEGFRKWS